VLLLVNGPPGVGKSTLARRYADEHPRSLVVEVDALRTQLGGWSTDEGSKQVARDLALDLITGHLSRGYDVIVPQYLGRPAFRDRLDALASELGVPFVEVVLLAPRDTVEARFRTRRSTLEGGGHPEADVPDEAVAAAVADASDRLSTGAETATRTVVDAAGDAETTYRAMVDAVGEVRRTLP
jgi:predicted kinase